MVLLTSKFLFCVPLVMVSMIAATTAVAGSLSKGEDREKNRKPKERKI